MGIEQAELAAERAAQMHILEEGYVRVNHEGGGATFIPTGNGSGRVSVSNDEEAGRVQGDLTRQGGKVYDEAGYNKQIKDEVDRQARERAEQEARERREQQAEHLSNRDMGNR